VQGVGIFRPGGTRPRISVIFAFIDGHRDKLGVESICRALLIAPSRYYGAERRELSTSARAPSGTW
jgi:hypothetical protein